MGLFSRFRARDRTDDRSLFQRLVMPRGRPPDAELRRIQEAAAASVARVLKSAAAQRSAQLMADFEQ